VLVNAQWFKGSYLECVEVALEFAVDKWVGFTSVVAPGAL